MNNTTPLIGGHHAYKKDSEHWSGHNEEVRLKARDRFTIASITKAFSSAIVAVTVVRPETVVRWHRSL